MQEEQLDLSKIKIEAPDKEVQSRIKKIWDSVAKPLDGLGCFETILAQIGAIHGSENIDIGKKAVLVLCADNGIVEEGISQSGQEVTAIVAEFMGLKKTSVCRMAAAIGADVIPVDIGINRKEPIAGVLDKKIACGTKNFRSEPAMTREEALRAISAGISLVDSCKKSGYRLIGTGEMGIGNTTTSSAVAAALLGCPAREVTGRGAGLSDDGLRHKTQVIREALEQYGFGTEEALRILQTVGGLDIAGLTGVFIGGAMYHIPIVLDGIISGVAALLAERLLPGCRDYMIPSHKGREPAAGRILEELGLRPVLDADMALGEGTGAVMLFSLLTMALSLYENQTTFDEIEVEQYERYE